MLNHIPFLMSQTVHHPDYTFRAEQTHQVVLERYEELRRARVALTARAAPELTVDAPRLVALGAEDEQAAGCLDLFGLLIADCLMLL